MGRHKRRLSLVAIVITLIIGLCKAGKVMNGRFTRRIQDEFELLVPHKVDQTGAFVSFHLPNFFHHNFAAARQKRESNHRETLRYRLFFNGMDHVVELLPNHGFVSPQLLRESHFKDAGKTLKGRSFRTEPPVMCHYTGKLQNYESSRVAISTCDGLAGFIETESSRYFIEPVDGHGANDDGHYLHVIHKIDSRSDKSRPCGTTDWHKGWTRALDRSARSEITETKAHRFMEVMVVADKKFLDFNRNNDPERYILTVMNMVSDFFHDASLGYLMEVVVTRIILLEEEEPHGLHISKDAMKTIKSFCKWQLKQQSLQSYDAAVLLTRHDFCIDKNCGLLGLANVAEICNQKSSCSINEDTGLMLGVTVTHELGHLLGADHDNDAECPSRDEHQFNYVMAPSVKLSTGKWSNCSRRYMRELFDDKRGECLNNEPKKLAFKFDDSLPGTIYNADAQCRMEFGDAAKLCQWKMETICESLICQIGANCRTRNEPAADGTLCGKDKWCIRKVCVPIGKRSDDAIAGGWSAWSEWTKCSRQCGGGIQYSKRDCTNPVTRNGGRYCLGESKRLQVCSTQPCPDGAISFRQQQCEAFNDGRNKWISHFKSSESCALFCRNENLENLEKPTQVKDGTLCKPGTNNLCIAGECKNVGCDWKLGSHAIDDRCGVCAGDGSECNIVNGTLENNDGAPENFISLPTNARNVVVKKLAPSASRMKLTDLETKTNLLGMRQHGEVNLGTEMALLVLPETNREEFFIRGPLRKSFQVEIGLNKVYFEYAEMKPRSQIDNSIVKTALGPFAWDFLQPDEDCDARCDGGVQHIHPVCVSRDGEQPDESCEGPKPSSRTRPCNIRHCGFKWQKDEWSTCSGCVQRRKIWCGQESRRWVDKPLASGDEKCYEADGMKPPIKRLCSSECNRKCGEKRLVRSAHDFIEHFKLINVLMLEPKAFIDCEDSRSAPNENLRTKVDRTSKVGQFHLEQPVKLRVFNERKSRKVKDGPLVVDKLETEKIEDIPIIKNKEQKLSDETFRTLGDKLQKELDVKHATLTDLRKAFKATKQL